jgi:hypothetical protein
MTKDDMIVVIDELMNTIREEMYKEYGKSDEVEIYINGVNAALTSLRRVLSEGIDSEH